MRKEAGSCGGSQAPPSPLSAKTDMELVTSADELEAPFTWKEGSVTGDGVTEKLNFYSPRHNSVSGGTPELTAVRSSAHLIFHSNLEHSETAALTAAHPTRKH